jgi:hypothetical protein
MNRSILSISALTVLGLALLPGSTVAQQGTLKQQLVGTWAFVSCDAKQPFCTSPSSGTLMFDANGRYAQVIAARGRPKPTPTGTGNRTDVSPEDYKAIAQGLVANFGTWSVNEADKALTGHVEGALFPNVEGTEGKETVTLAGDEMRISSGPVLGVNVWRRVK